MLHHSSNLHSHKLLPVLLAGAVLACPAASFAAGRLNATVTPHQIVLQTGERTYTIGDKAVIQPLGLQANIVGTNDAGKGIWMHPKSIIQAKLVRNDKTAKIVTAAWDLTAGNPRYRLELTLEVRAGVPALTVTSRVRRLSADYGSCYYYWGFSTPVTDYTTAGAPAREFLPTEWDVRPRSRWIYVSQKKSGQGFGIITTGRVGRSPANGEGTAPGEVGAAPYLICTPKTESLNQGASLDVDFTVFAARSAKEVAAVYKQVAATLGDKVFFDQRTYSRAALMAKERARLVYRLETGDGLQVGFSADGRIATLSAGDRSLLPTKDIPISGLLLCDQKVHSAPTPLGGHLIQHGQTVVQRGDALGVVAQVTYQARPDRLDVACELRDTTGQDRAISAYFALPVNHGDHWRWGDSIEQSRPVVGEGEYLSASSESGCAAGANGLNSLYPFSALSGPVGLGLSIPLDQPRFCRLAYDADTQQYYAVFDLALTRATLKFPSRANFNLSVFTYQPRWGFRACVAKYYRMFPQFFVKRVKREGGWVCWGNCADVPNIKELGYAYHWGPSGPEACKWDNEHGLYAFPYIEATNMHQTMEGMKQASSEDVVKRLEWIADPKRTEPLPKWKYDFPYASYLGNRDAVLRKSAAAYLKSLLYDAHGHIYGHATKSEFGLLIAKYIPCDANPYLPGGSGDFFLNFWLPKTVAYMESTGGKINGIGMDNFHVGDTALGRRREQFAYETIPLTFETATGQPVLIKNFTTYEWTAAAARRLRPQGKFIMANTCSATFPFTYQLLDIHGYEWNLQHLAAFARTIAYHKPVCSLPVQPEHKQASWIKWHLRYGFFPGGYANYQTMLNRPAMVKYVPIVKQLQAAGWEPVTLATSNVPQVTVERFGGQPGGPLLFTVYNNDQAPHRATIKIDREKLGVAGTVKLTELVSGKTGTLSKDSFTIEIAPKDVQVFRVEKTAATR